MLKDEWEKIEKIADRALSVDMPEREILVRRECKGNPALYRSVTELLNSIEESEGFLEDPFRYKEPFWEELSEGEAHSMKGRKIGPYRLESLIGHGGMGSVWLAERDDNTFSQRVALKLIRRGMATPSNIAWFRREQQILAGLTHANIARLYDGGMTEEGLPYLIMECVDGQPLTEYCRENKLNLKSRLELFHQVCLAVQYAHKNLIIHRDLKPSNIFVDSEGEIKLLDFGIGKAISNDHLSEDAAGITKVDEMAFTPEYASPEQLEGEKVSTSSDIYSLGIVLYEMLTGQRPYDFSDKNRVQMVRDLPEITIDRPISVVKKNPSTLFLSEFSEFGNEIDDIVLKALHIEQDRRYESAGLLARDISNYLKGRPVEAKPDSRRYRFAKFVKRNQTGVTLAALAAILFIAGIAGILWQANHARMEAERAVAESERAVAMKDFLVNMITAANPFVSPGETPTVRDLLEQGSRSVEEELAGQPALTAEMLGVIGSSYRGMGEMLAAREHLERSLALYEAGAELDLLTIADIKAAYAHTLIGSGETEEARDLARQTLEELEGAEESEQVLGHLLNVLATSKYILGDFPEALSRARQAASVTCDAFGEQHQSCISSLLELKYFYERVNDYDEALSASERAFHLAETVYSGEPHPQLIMAAGAYGDALSLHARTEESIPLLEHNVELSLEVYGEENFRYARALDWLSLAYQAAGRTHDVLLFSERTFEIGGAALPRNPLTPVWLHRIVRSSIALHMADHAEEALNTGRSELPERIPEHIEDAFALQRVHIRLLRAPGDTSVVQELTGLIATLQEKSSNQLTEAKFLAAGVAVRNGNTQSADSLLISLASTIENENRFKSDKRPARLMLLQSKYQSLLGNFDDAAEKARLSLDYLYETGHRESPDVAESQAVLAGLQCRSGDVDEGRKLLEHSLGYWSDVVGTDAGAGAMRELAPECRGM